MSISSWLIENYFTKIYSSQIQTSIKSIQPLNIIGLHDMFSINQILQLNTNEFEQLCRNKLNENLEDSQVKIYNNYLERCGLIDLIDLFHQCQSKEIFVFNSNQINNQLDRLFFQHLYPSISIPEQISSDSSISRDYLKHTFCTYLFLLLDTRNEHALIHCLSTPSRVGIERRTIVELRRLTKLSKNESLTIYQILLSFIRRKELISNRIPSSQSDSNNSPPDPSFIILEKYYVGLKEFFDFLEQLQMMIEENEHLKISSLTTFRKLLTLISKQLRKDSSLTRCEGILKEIIEEFSQTFQTIISSMECASPIRSASSGGTLAGRRFLRSVAYLCAKQIVNLPILKTTNEHYDSPSTGLRKATASRLLKSPLTPIPMVMEEVPVEEKVEEIPSESVFVWQKKNNEKGTLRRKSQRCLNLSTIDEQSCDSEGKVSSQSSSSRQPLGEVDLDEDRAIINSSQTLPSLSENDQENRSINPKKRPITNPNIEPIRKKPKKIPSKPLAIGQKTITNFFQSKN